MQVGLGTGYTIVLDGDPAPPAAPAHFRGLRTSACLYCARRLDGLGYHLVRR